MKIFAINLGPFQFSPSILPVMAGLFFIAVFAGLGRWQVDRMMEKQEIEEQYQMRAAEPAQPLPMQIEDPEAWRFRKVRVNGVMQGAKQFLLDNQVRRRQAGYNVLTPLTLDDGRTVLVDRGWVPLVGGARERLPNVAVSANAATNVGPIEGRFYMPFGDPVSLAESSIEKAGWPAVVSWLDFDAMERMLGVPLERFTIRMDAEGENGYLREWPAVAFSSKKHLGYAVQWFAMSLTVAILVIVLNTKRRR